VRQQHLDFSVYKNKIKKILTRITVEATKQEKERKEKKPKPEEQEGMPQHQHCPPKQRRGDTKIKSISWILNNDDCSSAHLQFASPDTELNSSNSDL
jgi:hypothetical protein